MRHVDMFSVLKMKITISGQMHGGVEIGHCCVSRVRSVHYLSKKSTSSVQRKYVFYFALVLKADIMSTRTSTKKREPVREMLARTVGFTPRSALHCGKWFAHGEVALTPSFGFVGPAGWLYAARGLYKCQDYHYCVEALTPCLRNEKTRKEAQHLLAFSLLHTKQEHDAAVAFQKSIKLGNETDWQPLVELFLDNPDMLIPVGTAGR
jgi:hypothetical protein